jgi:hypothetical protein
MRKSKSCGEKPSDRLALMPSPMRLPTSYLLDTSSSVFTKRVPVLTDVVQTGESINMFIDEHATFAVHQRDQRTTPFKLLLYKTTIDILKYKDVDLNLKLEVNSSARNQVKVRPNRHLHQRVS